MISLYAKLISGGASLIVQVLLVVGAVLAFMFIDPFGIVSPEKRMLSNTPAQVESIKRLGELITAEYYGEVVSSLGEAIDSLEEAEVEEFRDVTVNFHDQFVDAINQFTADQSLKTNFRDSFHIQFNNIVDDPLYDRYTKFIFAELSGRELNLKQFEKNKSLTKPQEATLYRRLYKNKRKFPWKTSLGTVQTSEFVSIFQEVVSKKNKKEYKRAKLAMIGRGWVKAGIDFDDFNEDNFVYNQEYQSIHFIGFEPKIISATINPWFIPEKGIEGFEFLVANRKVKMRSDFVLDVKRQCLNKLTDQALRKGIKHKAQDNAAEFLKGFFSMLLDQDIKQVSFHENHLNSVKEFILMDDIISNEEIYWIDSALIAHESVNGNKNGWEKPVRAFVDSLSNQQNYMVNGVSIKLNSRSHILFKVFEDRVVDSTDVADMIDLISENESDQLWYGLGQSAEFDSSAHTDSLKVDFQKSLAKLLNPEKTLQINEAIAESELVTDEATRKRLANLFPDP